ncbi:hypothetical protein [Longispora urticae]
MNHRPELSTSRLGGLASPPNADQLGGDLTAATARLRAALQHDPVPALPDAAAVQKFLGYQIAHITLLRGVYADLERDLATGRLLAGAEPATVDGLRHQVDAITAALELALTRIVAAEATILPAGRGTSGSDPVVTTARGQQTDVVLAPARAQLADALGLPHGRLRTGLAGAGFSEISPPPPLSWTSVRGPVTVRGGHVYEPEGVSILATAGPDPMRPSAWRVLCAPACPDEVIAAAITATSQHVAHGGSLHLDRDGLWHRFLADGWRQQASPVGEVLANRNVQVKRSGRGTIWITRNPSHNASEELAARPGTAWEFICDRGCHSDLILSLTAIALAHS